MAKNFYVNVGGDVVLALMPDSPGFRKGQPWKKARAEALADLRQESREIKQRINKLKEAVEPPEGA